MDKNNNLTDKETKHYHAKEIKKMFNLPSWIYFIPCFGYYIFARDLIENQEKAGLLDISTPGGKFIMSFNNKYFLSLSIFLPIWTLLCAVFANASFWIWKSVCKKAVKLNEKELLYKDFGSI